MDEGRRRFLRTGIAAAGAALAAGATEAARSPVPLPPALLEPDGESPLTWTTIRAAGAQLVRGPAPRGVPMIPLVEDDQGRLLVAPTEWRAYAYCGAHKAPGLRRDYAGDNLLRYHVPEGDAAGAAPWYAERVGQPIEAADLRGTGKQAVFRFRSEGATGEDLLLGVLYAMDHTSLSFASDAARAFAAPALQVPGLVAYYAACTHFCCVAGPKTTFPMPGEASGAPSLYCPCHVSVYNPRVIEMTTMIHQGTVP